MIYLDKYTEIGFINLRSNLHHWSNEICICMYFFALLLFLIYQNKTKKLDLLHVLHPTASVSAYLAVMRRKAQGFFHYHAIQRHVTAAISNPKLFCA